MKQRISSIRYRILLPATGLMLVIVMLLNGLYSGSYIRMIQRQERDVNAVGFATISNSVDPLINTSIM